MEETSRLIYLNKTIDMRYLTEVIIPTIAGEENWDIGDAFTYWTDLVGTADGNRYVFTWSSVGRREW